MPWLSALAGRAAQVDPHRGATPGGSGRRRRLLLAVRPHLGFLALLAVGGALRAATLLAYRPALLWWDSYRYLWNLAQLDPAGPQPIGYPLLLLRPLLAFGDLALIPLVQHALGVAMAVTLYLLLLRHGAHRGLAAVATGPVLLDGYQLHIEQMVMAETLFQALVVAGLTMLVWRRRPGPGACAAAGLLLGLSVTVRLVGQVLIVPAVVFVALTPAPWTRRLVNAAALVAVFAVPLTCYAAWYHHTNGQFTLSTYGGRALYARVAPFADCAALELPQFQQPLCPPPRLQQELTVNDFVWRAESPANSYAPPPMIPRDAVLGDFARRVVRQQPVATVRAVTHDFYRGFAWSRRTRPKELPVETWQFPPVYPKYVFNDWDPARAVRVFGGNPPRAQPTLARLLRSYQLRVGSTPGTLLLVALVTGAFGVLSGRTNEASLRAACFLWTATGASLLLAAAAFEFSWRYQLPALVLLPPAGVLGATLIGWPHRPTTNQHRWSVVRRCLGWFTRLRSAAFRWQVKAVARASEPKR